MPQDPYAAIAQSAPDPYAAIATSAPGIQVPAAGRIPGVMFKGEDVPGKDVYRGIKAGAAVGSLPLALGASLPQIVGGVAGGTVGTVAGQQIAKSAGAGETGQEVAGDVGGLVGGGLGTKAPDLANTKVGQSLLTVLKPLGVTAEDLPVVGSVLKGLRVAKGVPGELADIWNPPIEGPKATLPAKPPQELLQASSLAHGAQTYVDPAAGLGQIPVRMTPPGAAGSMVESVAPTPQPLKPNYVQREALRATGNEPLDLKPNVPLKDQLPAVKAQQTDIPEGHTPVTSSAVKSFKYDATAREFHVRPSSGNITYVYGDVSPEEAQAFASAESKGKAWVQIRNNPAVAKIINGKRVAVKPVVSSDDLTGILQDSLAAAKARGAQ